MSERTPEIPDALLDELMKHVGDPKALTAPDGLLRQLNGRLIERCLQAEMTEHLGYEKNGTRKNSNARNGTSRKTVHTDAGQVDLDIPRDRAASFQPQLIKKNERRLTGFDDRVLALFARGLSTREIADFFEEAYGASVSASLISQITDAALEEVHAWRQRRLDAVYPIVFLDGFSVRVKSEGVVVPQTVYVAVGITMEGHKEVLGLWMAATEGAKFWLSVVSELKNRGVDDVLIACCDGLKGFPEAIAAVFPNTVVQTCIVHMVRNSLRLVAWGTRKKVAADLRPIYRAANEPEAQAALTAFEQKWGSQYPSIGRSWRDNWERVVPFLSFPADIRRVIYTTNIIESLNSQLRKMTKLKGHFQSEESTMKLLYIALQRAQKRWTIPIARWDLALQQFAIYFEGRVQL